MLQKIIEELDKVKVGARLFVKKGVKFSSSVSQQEVELNWPILYLRKYWIWIQLQQEAKIQFYLLLPLKDLSITVQSKKKKSFNLKIK